MDVEYRGDNDGALKGTMVHRLMEVLVSSKNSIDGSKLVKEIINEYDDSSKREYHESLLKDVLITIRSGGYEPKYGAPKDILKELLSADECLCEVPFSFKDGENLYSGFIDLVYRKNGAWHIIDYKTNADDRDLDKHYKDQLDLYSKAFKHLTGESADACVYHIGL